MNIGFSSLLEALGGIFFEQDLQGDNIYTMTNGETWSTYRDDLYMAQNHPILTPAMLFVSNLFAQARFTVKQNATNKEILNHWILKLLFKPNHYQTTIDFLEAMQFVKIARGQAIIYLKTPIGMNPTSMFVLDPKLITYPDGFKTPMLFDNQMKATNNQTVIYDKDGPEKKTIQLKNLLFLYDLPNGLNKKNNRVNRLQSKSRISNLKQVLINTEDSLTAKNIILKSNGKEMLSQENKDGFPLDPDSQAEAKRLFNVGYGLGKGRSRSFVTKASVKWKSMHIPLRDLGLDEGVKTDGNLIYTALHIPKDVMSLEAKKTTYNNYAESMTSFIQNDIQSMLNDFCLTMTKAFLSYDISLVGSYEHLPVMQFLEKRKYESVTQRGKALRELRTAGIPDELALELCKFDTKIKLNEVTSTNGTQENEETNSNSEGSESNAA